MVETAIRQRGAAGPRTSRRARAELAAVVDDRLHAAVDLVVAGSSRAHGRVAAVDAGLGAVLENLASRRAADRIVHLLLRRIAGTLIRVRGREDRGGEHEAGSPVTTLHRIYSIFV